MLLLLGDILSSTVVIVGVVVVSLCGAEKAEQKTWSRKALSGTVVVDLVRTENQVSGG